MATVLIVEDEAEILVLAQSFPEEQGHQTLLAPTADEALAILTRSEAADALFVDVILNGNMQAGIELAKRAVELKPGIKVVYSTGLSVTDGMKALFLPGSAVLEKPYTVDQLLRALTKTAPAKATAGIPADRGDPVRSGQSGYIGPQTTATVRQ